jgi:hypothetical protein
MCRCVAVLLCCCVAVSLWGFLSSLPSLPSPLKDRREATCNFTLSLRPKVQRVQRVQVQEEKPKALLILGLPSTVSDRVCHTSYVIRLCCVDEMLHTAYCILQHMPYVITVISNSSNSSPSYVVHPLSVCALYMLIYVCVSVYLCICVSVYLCICLCHVPYAHAPMHPMPPMSYVPICPCTVYAICHMALWHMAYGIWHIGIWHIGIWHMA